MRVEHPNVVRTLDVGTEPDFMAMEFVEGQTLRGLGTELGVVPEELCRHIASEAARGLAAIHGIGALHRDIKPENVLITRDHDVKIMDLGLARLADASMHLSKTAGFVGTALYAAPEQFSSQEPAPAADWYALGLVLYELATGRLPGAADSFTALLRARLEEPIRPAGEINTQLSPFFEAVLGALLDREPADRLAFMPEEESDWWTERARAIRNSTKAPLRRIRIPRDTALYGREREIGRLREAFDRAAGGEGQVLLVEGEAGIGKSRLVDEFAGGVESDIHFLFGAYPPVGGGTARVALRDAFSAQFDGGGCAEALVDRPALARSFEAFLRGEPCPDDAPSLDADAFQTAVLTALRTLAGGRPTILLIDDLHVAGEEGLAIFDALARAIESDRILLIGSARRNLDATWATELARLPHVERLGVERLGAKDVGRLLVDALGSPRLAEDLGYRILTKSDGNPFFVFEILRGLRDGRFLETDESGDWVQSRTLDEWEIPSSILDLVDARLAGLAEEERDLLDLAACAGFEFDPLLLVEALGENRTPLLKRLALLERRQRVVRAAGRRYVFDHNQIQEALYDRIPELLREDYHRQLADAIVRRAHGEPDGRTAVDVVEHYLRASDPDAARDHLDAACAALTNSFEHERLRAMLRTVLATASGLDEAARLELLTRLGTSHYASGHRLPDAPELDGLEALAEREGRSERAAAAYALLSRFAINDRRADDCIRYARTAVEIACAIGHNDLEQRSRIVVGMALGVLRRPEEALHELDAVPEHDEHWRLIARPQRGLIQRALGNLETARRELETAVDGFVKAELPADEAAARVNLGLVLSDLQDYAAAQAQYERAIQVARDCGSGDPERIGLSNLGSIHERRGEFARAIDYTQAALRHARDRTDARGIAFALGNLSKIRISTADFAAADTTIEEADEAMRALGNPALSAYIDFYRAELARRRGRWDDARRAYECVQSAREHLGTKDPLPMSLVRLGQWHAAEGRDERAASFWASVEEIGVPTALVRMHALRGETAEAARLWKLHEPAFTGLERVETLAMLGPEFEAQRADEARRMLEHAPEAQRDAMLEHFAFLRP